MYFCHDNIILWKQESYFDIDFIIRSAFSSNLELWFFKILVTEPGGPLFRILKPTVWDVWSTLPENIRNQKFFWWFRGYRKRLVAWNGLRPVFHSYRNQPWFGFISDLICIVNELIMFYKKETLVLNRGKILTKEK